ncbi:MAG: BMP family ABC transporter substrate-binding protein [Lachnospiraceae bacterium]|nr:BMP family ABC transporter substrate-binding protein [Lachnospiraceae bacterium]
MKKFFALLMVLCMALSLCACGTSKESSDSDFKVGFIMYHDENSTYDLNFINAAKAAAAELGLSDDQIIIKTNIEENDDCYNTACDLVDAGCDIIFADSFGHEPYMIEAAKKFPEVQFCHSTGVNAHLEGLDNYQNAFASIYEGRYLAGVAAGMKLNEMIENGTITADQAKMGYVGAYTYAEVVSGYTSFFLGARSVCPSVTMEVTFTGEWYNEALEKEGATKLINNGCVLISQHADSMGAPTACETAGVPNVSYNGSTISVAPNTFIVSSRIDWTPYYVYAITCAMEGKDIDTDWTGSIATGSVLLTEFNTNACAAGTEEKVAEVQAALEAGTIHVFDTSTFTVGGETITSYLADETVELVTDGYFHESEYISAPSFAWDEIDGITLLDRVY